MQASGSVEPRIASLEQQLQALIDGLGSNKSTSKTVKEIEKELGIASDSLAAGKPPSRLFGNPKSLMRWVLMLVGLLFSDAVAWIISAVAHHQTSLPVPFLTAGTVVMSCLLVFSGALKFAPNRNCTH